MSKKYILIPVVLIFICFYACTHKPQEPLTGTKTTTTTNTDTNKTVTVDTTTLIPDTVVCFQRDVLPIFNSSCAMSGCHDAGSAEKGYVLTTYAHIVARGLVPGNSGASKVYLECADGKMPKSPVPALTAAQLSLIKKWIDAGAHDDTDCAIMCDTTKYTYKAAIAPLLSEYCYSCHSAASAPANGGNIVLDNYNSLLQQAQNGNLQGGVQHLPGYNAMPLSGNKLEDCQITQINKWIEAGAQNN
jgi:uncharacterized membrane protein